MLWGETSINPIFMNHFPPLISLPQFHFSRPSSSIVLMVMLLQFISAMITDIQLAAFANILGVSLFLLVVLYHFVAVNNPKRKEE